MIARIICDSNIHDVLAADLKLKRLVDQAQADALIDVMTTHIQFDELAAVPAERDIGQTGSLTANRILTEVFVLDHSRLGEARLGSETSNAAFMELQGNSFKNTNDAIIGATALAHTDILVTNDVRFTNRFRKLAGSVQVMSSKEFGEYLVERQASASSQRNALTP
jgi:predicted nucleic acid-binding protein